MKRSTERILTTHAGSLPRPADLLTSILAQDAGTAVDAVKIDAEAEKAVRDAVRQQVAAGVDVVNDGEMSKPSFGSYTKDRLHGFRGEYSMAEVMGQVIDLSGHLDFAEQLSSSTKFTSNIRSTYCHGPISFKGENAVWKDIENLQRGVQDADGPDTFLSSASPGLITIFSPNHYYASYEEYLGALANAMREEYEAIHRAGIVLQLDCPDLALAASGEPSVDEHRRKMELRVEALNYAVSNIPAEAMRIHVCWGNGELPRDKDVELREIIDIVLKAKPAGISLMAANGRHDHEWTVFDDVELPDGKYIIPGVVDSTSNIIEHPETVAQRLVRYASVVGKENVMAGTDCGFGSIAGMTTVVPSVAWAKLQAMVDGAMLASERLW